MGLSFARVNTGGTNRVAARRHEMSAGVNRDNCDHGPLLDQLSRVCGMANADAVQIPSAPRRFAL